MKSEIMLAACRVFNTSLFGANWHLRSFQKMHVSPLLLFSVLKNCNNVTLRKTKEILVSLAKLLKCLSPHHRNVIYCLSRFVETDYDRPLYYIFLFWKDIFCLPSSEGEHLGKWDIKIYFWNLDTWQT